VSKILPKDEFVARFKAHMLATAGDKFEDGSSIAEYADEAAPAYWAEQHKDGESPEECAEADISYWEDE
jgi:hypothetical protein